MTSNPTRAMAALPTSRRDPEEQEAERRVFALIDAAFIEKQPGVAALTGDPGMSAAAIDRSDLARLAGDLGKEITRHRHPVRTVKIAVLSILHLTTDHSYLHHFFLRYSPKHLDIDNDRSALILRDVLYTIIPQGHASNSLNFLEITSIFDTHAFDYVFRRIEAAFRAKLIKALSILLVPVAASALDGIAEQCRWLDARAGKPATALPRAAKVLDDLRRRLVRRGEKQSRERQLIGWFWITALRGGAAGVAPALLRRIQLLHGLAIQPPQPFPATAIRHLIRGPRLSPVYPAYKPGTTECVAWDVPAGFDTAGRSPYEPSKYFELENAVVLDDSTIGWHDGGLCRLGDSGETQGKYRSSGIVEVRVTRRRWREYGRRHGINAVDITTDGHRRLYGRYFLASAINFMGNFGHFIYQSLPNIATYLNTIDDGREIILDRRERPFHRAFLELARVDSDRIVFAAEDAVFEGNVSFFEESFGPQVNFIRVRELRRRAVRPEPASSPFGKRIYLSRRRVTHRRTGNEEEIEPFLRSHGFDVVIPDDHPPALQIAILENADVIVSPHGSALTLLVFCQSPKVVIEGHSKTRPADTTFMHMLSHRVYWARMTSRLHHDGSVVDHWNMQELRALIEALG